MPELVALPATASAEQAMEVLRRDGALILADLLTTPQVDALLAELMPYIQATPPGRDAFSGDKTTRTGALVARSPRVRPLVTDPRILKLCDHLLLPSAERYQLHLTQVIRIQPGQGAQPIHRDRWAWGTHLKGIEPQLNTIWALTDFTKANGATQVVPGSVDWPDNRRPETREITWAEMPRGSALVYTGSVFHGGGANVANTDRIGLNITYSLAWLRQEENQYLACPPEVARALDPALQRLIGYTMGSYALGYYTPPLAPGLGPEVVPPEYALSGDAESSRLGSAALLDSLVAAVRDQ
ncbi:MAG: phytanoyl-CoA dioxygenase family protein [Alphaproteobacteria bacterium]|nr:phytanoyl-CoA dioxygenase family protein [Alphaproteobacteria bacterium]